METMTSGSAYRHLWRYALPLILGNWLQLAYNAADSVIAGRFLGAQALAAEGAAAPVMNLVILGISGVTVGAGVLMSEFFGAGKQGLLRRTLATTLAAGAIFSVLVAGAGWAAAPALTNGFQGFYRGMGRMQVTLLGTLVQISLRVAGTAALAPRVGLTGIAWACGIGWCAMLCFEIPYYFHFWRKRREK